MAEHSFNLSLILNRPSSEAIALKWKKHCLSYGQLRSEVSQFVGILESVGVKPGERVAIWLPKTFKSVVTKFAVAAVGAVFVPINPQLKNQQVAHILRDSGASFVVTSEQRLKQFDWSQHQVRHCIVAGRQAKADSALADDISLNYFEVDDSQAIDVGEIEVLPVERDTLVALLYTSGSTGMPKGVMISHQNLLAGADSVSQYLQLRSNDKILAVLPFSFDYGLNQLISGVFVGATVVLLDYLLPAEVLKAVANEQITVLAGVPPLWVQLLEKDWCKVETLRLITNSGGALTYDLIKLLEARLPTDAQIFPMYGLTEAFRSTFLDPELIHDKVESMGKAIPGAEIVLVDQGKVVEGEGTGELVHRGVHVSLGYWNLPQKTAEKFKPLVGVTEPNEVAVWSGDKVRRDQDGYLYFIGREDEMIKTSGYRVSPLEIETSLTSCDDISQAVAFGVADPELGQAIALVVESSDATEKQIRMHCRQHLPNYMQPKWVSIQDCLPRNPNGKIDRSTIKKQFKLALS